MFARRPRALSAAILTACLIAPPAIAQDGSAAPETGLLTDLENGDISCYLALKPEGGEPVYVSADFALCEQTDLIDSTVRLVYEEASVLAASCEGDMDCGKSDIILLAVEMTKAH